jgi:hypothetical protein
MEVRELLRTLQRWGFDRDRRSAVSLQCRIYWLQQPVDITLNFVVAVLGTTSKATIAVVLSSAISQMKWNWFALQHRELGDFALYDEASRGPLGSLQLLWRTRFKRLTSIGAAMMVLTVVFDPFIQLLINYPEVAIQTPMDNSTTLSSTYGYEGGGEDHNNRTNGTAFLLQVWTCLTV